MVSPYFVRLICAAILIVCSIIVLALSADLEHEIRQVGFSSSSLPYAAFVGAFTLLVEVVFIIIRRGGSQRLGAWVLVDLAWAGLMWVMWLAAASTVTEYTRGCDYLDVSSSPCTQVRVDTAFLWIGWLVWSFIIGVLLWIGIREHRNGNRGVWQSPIGSNNGMTSGTTGAPMTERPVV